MSSQRFPTQAWSLRRSHLGVIAIRIPSEIRNDVLIPQVTDRISELDESDVVGNIVIIEPDRTRIRREPQ